MHSSQSSDSVADGDAPSAAPPDQDPVMPPPTSPPNDHLHSPSTISAQPLQVTPTEQEQPSPTSPQTQQPEPQSEPRPADDTPDSRPAPQPASAPTASPPRSKEESPRPAAAASTRRQRRKRNRQGRPPNINENSLMRRLECVMAVESGRMSMDNACTEYEISNRTFYRWLRNKDRLIELTGFTEDDFKNGNPPVSKQTLDMQDSARMPPHSSEPDSNLPRLPNQPAVSTADNRAGDSPSEPPTTVPAQTFVGSKRRLPKAVDPNREFPPQTADRFSSPNVTYYRRNFTKMPPQAHYVREPGTGPSERQAAARSTTRMRRDSWHEQPSVEYVRVEDRGLPIQYAESPGTYKRRKVVPAQHIGQPDDPEEPVMMTSSGEPQPPEERPIEEFPFVNDNSGNHESADRTNLPREGIPHEAAMHGKPVIVGRPPRKTVLCEPVYDPRMRRKHRIEVMMGRRRAILAWYDGTAAEDIKASIARRFALLPEAQWALVDNECDEIIISDGLPSGRYTLKVLS